jgi:zinc protease
LDPPDRAGLFSLMASALDSGTPTMDALAIADHFDALGAHMQAQASFDGLTASLTTVAEHAGRAFPVFSHVLQEASFPETECVRLRQQRLTALEQRRDRADATCTSAFYRLLYGDRHPYGHEAGGRPSSVERIQRNDLIAAHQAGVFAEGATLIVVGDITLEQAEALVERYLGTWRRLAPAGVSSPLPEPPAEGRQVLLVNKPGAPQADVRIGCRALPRTSEDHIPALVLNRILGGQFSSRINRNLREQRGLTYGAWSAFTLYRNPSPFIAGGSFPTESVGVAAAEILREIGNMCDQGITTEELRFAQTGMSGSFALSWETPRAWARILQNLILYDLPADYYDKYLGRLAGVTRKDVLGVARRWLDPSSMAVVITGDAERIRPQIEELSGGKITTVEMADVLQDRWALSKSTKN